MRSIFIFAVLLAFSVIFAGLALEHTAQGVLFSLATTSFFLNLPGLLIVVGGTAAALAASFPVSFLGQVPAHLAIIMRGSQYHPPFYIETIVKLSNEARTAGLLTLSQHVAGLDKDNFLHDAIALVSDGADSEYARALMHHELSCVRQRHEQSFGFYDKAAAIAPAFGIIGTLAGFVGMLANLSASEYQGLSGIFGGMATALSSTLYGTVLSSVVFGPIANRLRILHQEEMLCKELIIVGALSIAAGEKPHFIEKKLFAFIAPGNNISHRRSV